MRTGSADLRHGFDRCDLGIAVVRNELDKMVFVRNDGNREAYVRTIFAFETTADWSLNSFQKLIHLNNNTQDWSWAWIEAPVTIGEGLYYVAVATYQHILAPNALSEISLSQVLMDKSVAAEDFTKLGDTYQILVYTQAIQADGFESPEAALNEGFGVIDTVLPFEGDAQGPGATMYDAIRYLDADGETDISTLVTQVVFGTYQDYPQIPLTHDGTLVSAEPGVETYAYYVQDDQEQYQVYILSDGPIYAPADCTGLFQSMTALTTVITENLDVSRVENMKNMFRGCTALTALDTTGWDTSAVTNLYCTFYQCGALADIKGIESWDTGSVTNTKAMLRECGITGDLDLRNWDVSNVTDMAQMFHRCYHITGINAAGWDTSSVTTMANMFYECFIMETLDVTGWDTSNVTSSNYTFNNNKVLVGGNGTKYSNSYRNAVYARIDLPAVVDEDGNVITPAVPGYLTHINDKP